MRFKVIVFLNVLLLLILLVVSCGQTKTMETDLGQVTIDEKKEVTTIETETATIEHTTDMEESLEVPDGFPQDLVPVYPDLFIISSAVQVDGSFVVIGMSKDSFDQVVTFYEDTLKEATPLMKESTDAQYSNMAEVEGVVFTVIINQDVEEEAYKSMVNLVVMPARN